ncbi:MAG: hypothetical protein J7M19_06730 [Planctomycetes bacterium]|nr:hypothetical protein [Planctomycetota bacterium]
MRIEGRLRLAVAEGFDAGSLVTLTLAVMTLRDDVGDLRAGARLGDEEAGGETAVAARFSSTPLGPRRAGAALDFCRRGLLGLSPAACATAATRTKAATSTDTRNLVK